MGKILTSWHRMGMEEGKVEGKIEGKIEALQSSIIKLANKKFNTISGETKNKILAVLNTILLKY